MDQIVTTQPGSETTGEYIPPNRAEKLLLKLCYENAKRAEAVCNPNLWTAIDSIKSIYGTWETTPTSPEQADDKNFKVQVNDIRDQVNEMYALCKSLMRGRRDRRLVPYRKTDEKQAQITQDVQDALLREKQWDEEKALALIRFIKYHFGGFKVCRYRRKTYKTERVMVPIGPQVEFQHNTVTGFADPIPIPGTSFQTQDLLMEGYSEEDVKSGEAVRAKCASMGLTFQGIADEAPAPDEFGNPIFTEILCTKTQEVWEDCVYGKALDARKIAINDPSRKLDRQSSIHEYDYLLLSEIKKAYPYNIEEFRRKASPTQAVAQQPGGSIPGSQSGPIGSQDFPLYETIETWIEPDWDHYIAQGQVDAQEIAELALKFQIPPQEFMLPGKLCVTHHKDLVLMDTYTNFLWDMSEYPHDIESFEPAEERAWSHGFVHAISSTAAALHKFRNLVMAMIRRRLNQSRIASKRLGITDDEMKKLDEESQTVWFNGQAVDLQQDLAYYLPPDDSKPGFSMVSYLENILGKLGVPPVLSGEADAETATQDQINNQRGQTIVNESFDRFVGCMMRFYRKHLGAVIKTTTRGRMIKAIGEDGAAFEAKWITPSDLTDRVEIVPTVSFNDLMERQQSQFIIAMMNVFAPVLQPQEIRAMWKICIRKGGLSQADIEEIEGSLGSYTDVKQEVEAMLADPSIKPNVNEADPHPLCIAVATVALRQRQMMLQAQGAVVMPDMFQNVQEYIAVHDSMFEHQMMVAKLMTPPPTKGKPQNEPPKEKADEQSSAREDAQDSSPADNGMATAAGLTGTASVPQMQ